MFTLFISNCFLLVYAWDSSLSSASCALFYFKGMEVFSLYYFYFCASVCDRCYDNYNYYMLCCSDSNYPYCCAVCILLFSYSYYRGKLAVLYTTAMQITSVMPVHPFYFDVSHLFPYTSYLSFYIIGRLKLLYSWVGGWGLGLSKIFKATNRY